MTDKVVDASAVVALLFDELTQEKIVARVRGASLHAPGLLEFEVANACLKRMYAREAGIARLKPSTRAESHRAGGKGLAVNAWALRLLLTTCRSSSRPDSTGGRTQNAMKLW